MLSVCEEPALERSSLASNLMSQHPTNANSQFLTSESVQRERRVTKMVSDEPIVELLDTEENLRGEHSQQTADAEGFSMEASLAMAQKRQRVGESRLPDATISVRGYLEYDRCMRDPALAALPADQLADISVVYPTREFVTQNSEFAQRHESMQQEADEHYHLLVALQVSDAEFDQMLIDNHNRKREVERGLASSPSW